MCSTVFIKELSYKIIYSGQLIGILSVIFKCTGQSTDEISKADVKPDACASAPLFDFTSLRCKTAE